MRHLVKWAVREWGGEDERHGDVVASGEIEKEGTPEELRESLTEALEKSYPKHAMTMAHDIDRQYDIEITPL